MTVSYAIALLFPVVLGVHTREEWLQRDAFVRQPALRRLAAWGDARTLACAGLLMVPASTMLSAPAMRRGQPAAVQGDDRPC